MTKIILLIVRQMPIIFSCCLLFTTIMALIPVPEIPDVFNFWDKAQHALAFITLTVMASFVLPQKLKTAYLGLILYGASIEFMQMFFTTTRVGELSDLIADSFGISIGFCIYLLANKFIIHLSSK
jgi:VanZ family protein